MGTYSEYLERKLDFKQITQERKKQLKRISSLRERDVLVYASDMTKNAPVEIDYTDLLPFSDQISNLNGKGIDIILETPGGFAEVVEDMVKMVRSRYDNVGIIIPGYCKSAGTIFSMAGDEILMGPISALGPIDAQIMSQGKRFSADAFLEGLKKIKDEVTETGKLNPAYIPILSNISPGEIQHCENAQSLSQELVRDWLVEYKFKYWNTHSSTGKKVSQKDKVSRANKIANELCKQSKWLTHGRSIKIKDLSDLKLKITDYSKDTELSDSITRYYTLMRMSFESNIYKIIETPHTQIYRFTTGPNPGSHPIPKQHKYVLVDFECPKCKRHSKFQANFVKGIPIKEGHLPYPVEDNLFTCPHCNTQSNLTPIRLQIEAQTGKSIVK